MALPLWLSWRCETFNKARLTRSHHGEDSKGSGLGNVIRIDDERVREHLGHIVRGTVEETLNAMLEAEADRLCNAERYERTQARRDQRSGSYERKLQTKAGQVTLKVPKLRVQTFETAIIERYRRRESSVEGKRCSEAAFLSGC